MLLLLLARQETGRTRISAVTVECCKSRRTFFPSRSDFELKPRADPI